MRVACLAIPAAVLLVLAGGCRAFDESLLDGGGADAGPSCDRRLPPPRPEVADSPSQEEVVFAIREMLIDQRGDRWETAGYDLDGLCTETEEGPVECLPPASSAPPEVDGEGGTDNALGHQLIPILLFAMSDFQAESRLNQSDGLGVILLRIRGWNGEANDPAVDVTMTQSVFGTTRAPDGPIETITHDMSVLTINGEEFPLPAWEGNDLWWARADSFLGGDPDRPRVRDDNAYMRDGTLVMRLQDRFPIIFGGPTRAAQFVLTDAVFTVHFTPDFMRVEEAIVAGRFAVTDLLATIESTGVCPGTEDFVQFSRVLDLAADIRGVPGSGGPAATCDAISFGLPFEDGVRGRIEGIIDGFGIPAPCTAMMDGGMPDGGPGDAGPLDSGMPDAGPPDAGPPDAGPPDAGPPDAGPPDAGVDTGV